MSITLFGRQCDLGMGREEGGGGGSRNIISDPTLLKSGLP